MAGAHTFPKTLFRKPLKRKWSGDRFAGRAGPGSKLPRVSMVEYILIETRRLHRRSSTHDVFVWIITIVLIASEPYRLHNNRLHGLNIRELALCLVRLYFLTCLHWKMRLRAMTLVFCRCNGDTVSEGVSGQVSRRHRVPPAQQCN